MEERECARASNGEERHGFGEAVDGSTPFLVEQKKDGGDERSGMANANPPNEIDDGESPRDGNADSPDAHTFEQEICDGDVEDHQQAEADGKTNHPALRRASSEDDRADFVRNAAEGLARL